MAKKASKKKPKKNAAPPKPSKAPGMLPAANRLGVSLDEVKRAKRAGCAAFATNGSVDCDQLAQWLQANPKAQRKKSSAKNGAKPSDIKRGVTHAWSRIEQDEAELSERYFQLRDSDDQDETAIDKARERWTEALKTLNDYSKHNDASLRGGDISIPKTEVIHLIRCFLAWHKIGISNSLRVICPRLEGVSDVNAIAVIVDAAMRESQNMAFAIGKRAKKLPEWIAEIIGQEIKLSEDQNHALDLLPAD